MNFLNSFKINILLCLCLYLLINLLFGYLNMYTYSSFLDSYKNIYLEIYPLEIHIKNPWDKKIPSENPWEKRKFINLPVELLIISETPIDFSLYSVKDIIFRRYDATQLFLSQLYIDDSDLVQWGVMEYRPGLIRINNKEGESEVVRIKVFLLMPSDMHNALIKSGLIKSLLLDGNFEELADYFRIMPNPHYKKNIKGFCADSLNFEQGWKVFKSQKDIPKKYNLRKIIFFLWDPMEQLLSKRKAMVISLQKMLFSTKSQFDLVAPYIERRSAATMSEDGKLISVSNIMNSNDNEMDFSYTPKEKPLKKYI